MTPRSTESIVRETENKPYEPEPIPVKAEDDSDHRRAKTRTGRGLTIQEKLFCRAITGPALNNAAKAAQMAGFSTENIRAAAVTGCHLCARPPVQREIGRLLAVKYFDNPKWAQQSVAELAGLARGENFLSRNDKGDWKIDLDVAAANGALGSIKELSIDPDTGAPKLKLHDRLKAIELLLKLHGRLVDKHEHSGPKGKPIEMNLNVDLSEFTDEELERFERAFSGGSLRVGAPGRN